MKTELVQAIETLTEVICEFVYDNSSELLTLLNEHDDFFKKDDEDNANEIIKLALKDHNPDRKDEHKELLKLMILEDCLLGDSKRDKSGYIFFAKFIHLYSNWIVYKSTESIEELI